MGQLSMAVRIIWLWEVVQVHDMDAALITKQLLMDRSTRVVT